MIGFPSRFLRWLNSTDHDPHEADLATEVRRSTAAHDDLRIAIFGLLEARNRRDRILRQSLERAFDGLVEEEVPPKMSKLLEEIKEGEDR